MNNRKRVLIIEDESDISELIEYNLISSGFQVEIANNGEAGLAQAQTKNFDLLILDLMLPGTDGLSVCRKIREGTSHQKVPILMLTAKSEENDVVLGLELGADDYMTKPFSPKELVARVRALLRRLDDRESKEHPSAPPSQASQLSSGPITIDIKRHEVLHRGKILPLTLAEFKLLLALVRTPGNVNNRDDLIDQLTGGDISIIGRNIDVHIRSIRKKLGQDFELIQTVRGVGYKWMD